MQNIKKLSIFTLFICTAILFQGPRGYAQMADETFDQCPNTSINQVTAEVSVVDEETFAYIRADREQDIAQATLFYRVIDNESLGPCVKVGTSTLQTSRWQQVGESLSLSQRRIQFVMALDSQSATVAGASSPKLVLTSKNPPCELVTDCVVVFDGQQFTLNPKKLSASTDSLRVGILQPIEDAEVQEAIYSVDGRQVYTRKLLEPFNVRYVGVGNHVLNRTVVLTNETYLTDTQRVQRDFTFLNAFGALYSRYGALITYIGIILSVLFIWSGVLFVFRWFYRRRHWQHTHVLKPTPVQRERLFHRAARFQNFSSTFRQNLQKFWKLYLLLGLGIGSVFILNSFIITTFKISGASMEPTLADSSIQTVLTLPVSVSKATGSSYIPKIGDIIVVNKLEHSLFDTEFTTVDNYVVKRVIGVPGDRVQVKGTVITIFNEEYPEGYVPDEMYQWISDTATLDEFNTDIVISANELFVVGDNRDASIDSRYYGPIKTSEVVGQVL